MIFSLLACTVGTPTPATLAPSLTADAGPDRTVPVGVAVKLDGSSSVGHSFQWDSGDGRQYIEPAPAVVYSRPGTYTAVLAVRDADGATVTDAATIVVHPRLAEAASQTSSTVVVDRDGSVHALVRDANLLVHRDGESIAYETACDGFPVALSPTAVLCDGPAELRSGAETVALPVGSRPGGLVSTGGVHHLTLRGTNQRGTVQNGVLAVTDTVPDPRALVALDGELLAARFRSAPTHGQVGGTTLAFDTGPDTDTGSRGVPNLLTLAASPDGRTVFVGGTLANVARGGARDGLPLTFETTVRGFFSVIDVPTGTEVLRRHFDNQGFVGSLAVDPLGTRVYVAFPTTRTVFVVDPYSGNAVGSLLDIGHGISGLAVSADGGTLYVNAELSRELRAYDVRDLSGLPDLIWSVPTVTEEPLTAQVLRGKQLFHDSTRALAKHGYIACATCHPDGDHDGQTWDFTDRGEGLRNTTSLLGRAGTGMGPVHWSGNFDEIQDFENDIRGPFQGDGLLSDADFRATDAPLGAPKAGLSADLDALAAYVTTLQDTPVSPHPTPSGGEEAFIAAGCDSCHPGPLFTDSFLDVRHDVGTLTADSGQRLGGALDGLDTPTLLGSWDSAPWLHDGSAATLREAIAAHDHSPVGVDLDLITDFVRSL